MFEIRPEEFSFSALPPAKFINWNADEEVRKFGKSDGTLRLIGIAGRFLFVEKSDGELTKLESRREVRQIPTPLNPVSLLHRKRAIYNVMASTTNKNPTSQNPREERNFIYVVIGRIMTEGALNPGKPRISSPISRQDRTPRTGKYFVVTTNFVFSSAQNSNLLTRPNTRSPQPPNRKSASHEKLRMLENNDNS